MEKIRTAINCYKNCWSCVYYDPDKRCSKCGRRCWETKSGGMAAYSTLDSYGMVHRIFCDECDWRWHLGRRLVSEVQKTVQIVKTAAEERRDPVYIYFLEDPKDGQIKIGRSKRPEGRRKAVLCRAKMLATVFDERGGYLETELHDKFDEYRTRGEWFLPSPELMQYIHEHEGRPDLEEGGDHAPRD